MEGMSVIVMQIPRKFMTGLKHWKTPSPSTSHTSLYKYMQTHLWISKHY